MQYSEIISPDRVQEEDLASEARRRILKDDFEIVDITFAEVNNYETNVLMEMYPLHEAIENQEKYGTNRDSKQYQDFMKYQKYRLNTLKTEHRHYLEELANDP